MVFLLGDVVYYGQDKQTRYVITRIHAHMNTAFEYDGESMNGSSFSYALESELEKADDQVIDSAERAYKRAMTGI